MPLYKSDSLEQAKRLNHTLSNFPNLSIIPITDDISIKAAQIRAIHGLRTPDTIHFASAVHVCTNLASLWAVAVIALGAPNRARWSLK